jgi:hypothetical protein
VAECGPSFGEEDLRQGIDRLQQGGGGDPVLARADHALDLAPAGGADRCEPCQDRRQAASTGSAGEPGVTQHGLEIVPIALARLHDDSVVQQHRPRQCGKSDFHQGASIFRGFEPFFARSL